MNTMTRRVIVNARNYDTPRHMPPVEREDITPFHGSEYAGAYRILAIIGTVVVGVPLIAKLVAGWLA